MKSRSDVLAWFVIVLGGLLLVSLVWVLTSCQQETPLKERRASSHTSPRHPVEIALGHTPLVVCDAGEDGMILWLPSGEAIPFLQSYRIVRGDTTRETCDVKAREGMWLNGVEKGTVVLTAACAVADVLRITDIQWYAVIATFPEKFCDELLTHARAVQEEAL